LIGVRLLLLLSLAACSTGEELTILSPRDIGIALPRGTRADEPATQKLFGAIESTGKLRWVYRHCASSALVLTLPHASRDAVLASWQRQPGWTHIATKGLTDELTRPTRDGFVELLVMPEIERLDGAEVDPIEQDLVLTYPDDLVVIALAGRCS